MQGRSRSRLYWQSSRCCGYAALTAILLAGRVEADHRKEGIGAGPVTGIWSMNPDGSDLRLLEHAVSGDFPPVIAADGRVVFTRLDHLRRDQQNKEGTLSYGAFNRATEASTQALASSATPSPTGTATAAPPSPTPSATAAPTPTRSVYYVAPSGNDANAGTQVSPWQTLQKAGDSARAGDDVIVLPGIYQGFRARNSGTALAPVRFLAQPGVVVSSPGSANSNSDNIWVRDVDYVVIDGFEVRNAPRAGIAVQGEPTANATGVVIRRCFCHDNGRWGIFTGFARDLLLEDNETSGSVAEHGIYVSNSGDRPVVRRNHVHDNHASGIQLNADPAQQGSDPNDPQGDGIIVDAVIEANVIHGNGTGGGAAINLASVRMSVIRNNLLYANNASGVAGWDDGEGSNLYGTRDNQIVGNTIVQPSNGRFAVALKNGSINNQVLDNILLHGGTRGSLEVDPSSQTGLLSDYNVVVNVFSDDSNFLTLAQWRALGFDVHSRTATAAALFVDAGADDYHLAATSPAIDAGTSVTALATDLDGEPRPQGAGFDIGADEAATAAGVSGAIRYYANATAVSDVSVRLDGAGSDLRLTDASGGFAFTGVPAGNWQITPEKLGGAANGISALDASYALQGAIGQRTLSPLQQLACDVTGNGTVSALDASRILQYKVGIIGTFPAALACGSDWLFVPSPAAVPNQQTVMPVLSTGACEMGTIAYTPLAAPATQQNFDAVLLGDCTGNWQPGSGAASARLASATDVRIAALRHTAKFMRLTLRVERPFEALALEIQYDEHLQPLDALRPRVHGARGAMVQFHERTPGHLTLAVASPRVQPAGTQILLHFGPRGASHASWLHSTMTLGITNLDEQ
jgi:hypothetical protein